MGIGVTVFAPTAPVRVTEIHRPSYPTTERAVRFAVLDNGKPNANHVLQGAATALVGQGGFVVVRQAQKVYPSYAAEEEILQLVPAAADLVLNGVGD